MLRFIMKCRGSWSVRDALDNMHRMDSNYWKKLISSHGDSLDILPAPEEIAARFAAGAQETAHLMRFIRSTYRASVIDFGRHLSTSALDAFPELDTLYLITTMELETLEQARDCIALIERRGLPLSHVKVLLNRVPERNTPDPKGMENQLGMPYSGIFPADDEALYDAWSEGRLIESSSKLGREFNRLSAGIVSRVRGESETVAPPVAPAARPFDKLFSFFSRSDKSKPEKSGASK